MPAHWPAAPVSDPEEFGVVRVGPSEIYLPSPATIREACERIQRTWSPLERYRRRFGMPDGPVLQARDMLHVQAPVCSTRHLDKAI
jgi:hypothetical protein